MGNQQNKAVAQAAETNNPLQVHGSLKQQGKNVAELVLFDDNLFEKVQKMGSMMAGSKSMIPKHLQGNPSDCSAIIMQAMRWGVDPYSAAQKTHVISGTLGYEAQLVNAILMSNAPIEGRPKYKKLGDWSKILGKFKVLKSKAGNEYQAPGWNLNDEAGVGVELEIKLKGEEEAQPFQLMLSQATVRNSTLWASDPFQQLCYLAIKRWARLYCPDVIMGVYTPDELEDIQNNVGFDNAIEIDGEVIEEPTPSKAEAFEASAEDQSEEAPAMVQDDQNGDINKKVAEENQKAAKAEAPTDVVYIKTPPGSGPAKGSLPCNGLVEAAQKLIKALEARYNNPTKKQEIEFIKSNNVELYKRIQKELPDYYTTLNDLG